MKKKRSESSGTWAGGYQHWEWPPPSPPAPIRTGGFASRPPPPLTRVGNGGLREKWGPAVTAGRDGVAGGGVTR